MGKQPPLPRPDYSRTGGNRVQPLRQQPTPAIDDDSIGDAQMANMAEATIKGRAVGSGTGDPSDLSSSQVATILAGRFADPGHTHDGETHVTLWASVAQPFTNLASAEAFFAHAAHRRIDLTRYTQVRFHVTQNAAAASGTYLRLKYATTAPTTLGSYSILGESSTQVTAAASTSGGINLLTSGWITIASAAKADVYLTVTVGGGDSAADPIFSALSAEFR